MDKETKERLSAVLFVCSLTVLKIYNSVFLCILLM